MILTPAEMAELIALMRTHGAIEVEVARGDAMLRVALPPNASPPPPVMPANAGGEVIVHATGTGRLLRHHPDEAEPFPGPGARVAAGDVLALLATGPLLRPVTAGCAGTVLRVLQDTGALIGHGTPLFAIAPVPPTVPPPAIPPGEKRHSE